MALHVYRFRREQPLTSTTIASLVGAGVTFVASSAGVVLDLQADDTQADDLIAACAREGLVYLSTDPVTIPDVDVLYQSTALIISTLDIVLVPPTDEVFGTVTGLSSMPTAVLATAMRELAVTVQSGLTYIFKAYEMTADGFKWVLKVIDDEYWPGPGSITVRVQYLWS